MKLILRRALISATIAMLLAAFPASLFGAPSDSAREIVPLEHEWKFSLSDDSTAKEPAFDDSGWRTLRIPHDWAWEAPYAPDAAQTDKGGYKPGGVGWYRRTIEMPSDWSGRNIRLEFDGVYMNSTVWLNGREIGGRAYGYISFGLDLTPHLRPGRNVLAVRMDNSREPSTRWYHGCGIYAPARLVLTSPLAIAPLGVHITTPNITAAAAQVRVETTLSSAQCKGVQLTTRVLAPDGVEVSKQTTGAGQTNEHILSVASPRLWDVTSPQLYTLVSELHAGDRLLDRVETRFGIREIAWKADTGFWLNGRNLKLLGVAEHLTAGPVGAAYPEKLLRWKLTQLKRMGVNAIRTAHNPQIPFFYDLCDELGILVMNEIFDGWSRKAPEDYGARFFADNWERDLREWVRRDRNHPCVVIYSIGNETHGKIASKLVAVMHEMDPTRPVTSGDSEADQMDVYGVNGRSEKQVFFKTFNEPARRPAKPIVSTEAPHTWQVRGYYRTRTWWRDGFPNKRQDPFPLGELTEKEIFHYEWAPASQRKSAKQIFNSSYDNAMARITARKNWELMRDTPWLAGHFRWTGWDYVGEAGYVHGGWPFRAFMGGALDLAGFEKDLFYFYQSQWTTEPMVHLLPHWTHPRMKAGTKIPVWAYSNADEVELFLNGRSLGRDRPGRKAEEMQCEWHVPWSPGTLEAVAYRNGKEVARTKHVTAGAPTQIHLSTDHAALAADDRDVAIVTVAQQDAAGVFYPYGENEVAFALEGPARMLSLENGNPVDTSPNVGVNTRRTFFGLTRAFIQSTRESGDVSLVAGAINGERRQLTSNQVTIDVRRIGLRGLARPAAFKVYYTTDGSSPTTASPIYEKPFAVTLGTTVRALVREGARDVLQLTERFATDAGLHWPSEGEKPETVSNGLQAEDANLAGTAKIESSSPGFFGSGYVTVSTGGSIEWYAENDGDAGRQNFTVRWQADNALEIQLNINGRDIPMPAISASEGWRESTVTANLRRGANTIRLTPLTGSEIRVDELTVTHSP